MNRSLKLLPLSAALLFMLDGAAWAATEKWVATRTLAHEVDIAQAGMDLRSGEPIHVAVALHLRNQDKLDALTNRILAGQPTKPLAREEFMARHAPSDAQVKAVVDHLTRNGFVNIQVADNHMLVSADGSAGTVKKAFRAQLRQFRVDGRDAYANVTDAVVPESLAGTVKAVLGLQNVHMAHTMIARPDAKLLAVTSGHKPTEFPKIYNANTLPTASNTTIGIIAQGSLTQTLTDLATFVSQSGYAAPSVSTVIVGPASTDTSGVDEWNLDSQDALAAAGGQVNKMIFYVATTLSDARLTAAYNKAVSDNQAKVINVSLGECETAAQTSGVKATDDAIFQVAVAQGQTFAVSSGDSGSYECGGKKKNFQSYPAVSPYVIAVGGTTLKTTTAGAWSSETVWKGGGGGPSTIEAAPTWQLTSGVLGAATSRGVPDISFDADPNTGALVIVNGSNAQIGGTSLSAPLFTGFWARLQSANGNALHFPAAALYQYGPGNPSLFHDVTSGTNGGFTAATGWDYASGFGSINIANFAAFIASHTGF
jgi:pseudomonalisin/xanthomonalisin